jgi:hypothetical protein
MGKISRFKLLVSSIKVEVKKKHFCHGWSFSCFAARLIERDLFWHSVPWFRLLCTVEQRCGFSLSAVFIACFATKPIGSETSKAERGRSVSTMVLSGTRGP